jgi:hypothetical protein
MSRDIFAVTASDAFVMRVRPRSRVAMFSAMGARLRRSLAPVRPWCDVKLTERRGLAGKTGEIVPRSPAAKRRALSVIGVTPSPSLSSR